MGNVIKKPKIDLSTLKRMLRYDPETGELRWKTTRGGRVKRGSLAGSKTSDGYLAVKIKGRIYPSHRIAWWLHEGYWPEHYIDHINGNRQDNRFSNLRAVSPRCNVQNTAKTSGTSSKYKGVCRLKSGRWMAHIQIDGKQKKIGEYDTEFEAACARLKAEQEIGSWSCDAQDHNLKTALDEIL